MIDVDVYRNAGIALLDGNGLYGEAASAHGLPYLYTPFGAALFAPLGWLDVNAAHVLWQLLLLGALFVIVNESLRYAAPHLIERHGLLLVFAGVGAALALEPIAQNLKFGQINLLIGAAILLDLRGRTGKLPQGMLIGLVAAIKLTPLLFAVYLLLIGRRHATKAAGITFAACTVIGFAIAFSSSTTYWTSVAYDTSRVGVAFVTNQSINGFFSRILGGPDAVGFAFELVSLLIGIAGLAIAVSTSRRDHRMLGDILCAVTTLLVSPISWSHHWVWIVPALAWLAFATDAPKWARPAAIAGYLLFWTSPIQWIPRGDGAEYHYTFAEMLQGNAYLFATLACVTALAVSVLRRQRAIT